MDGTPIIIKKKKGHGEHAHHGGSWKVAYADFVTAMMAFFMVMWIMGLSDETKAQVQGYFNDPMGFSKTQPLSKNIINFKGMPPPKTGVDKQVGNTSERFADESELEATEKQVSAVVQKAEELKGLFKNIETDITEEGLRIEFVESAGSVFFETGGITIRPEAMKAVQAIAGVLAHSGRRLIIEGHTDARPYAGTGYDNWDLSTDRAASMRRALTACGVPSKQIYQVRGYADTKLRIPEDPYSFANRRVTILLPFKQLTEQVDDLPKNAFKKEVQAALRKDLGQLKEEKTVTGNPDASADPTN